MTKEGNGKTGQIASTLALVIGGKNTFGYVDDLKLPDWEFDVQNEESIGLIKSPKVSFSLMDLSASHIDAMVKGEAFIAKGSVRENGIDVPYTATMTVQMHKLCTQYQDGEHVKRDFEGRVNTFEENVNGQQTIKYNRDAMELSFAGGENVLSNIANNTL